MCFSTHSAALCLTALLCLYVVECLYVPQAGCKFPEDRIVVAECEPGYLGRYLRHGLEICYNNYQGDPDELRNTMVHELVHAYDECRGKDFDWTNCRHIACSEVRSSPCRFEYLCAFTPGHLFECSLPVWKQRRILGCPSVHSVHRLHRALAQQILF